MIINRALHFLFSVVLLNVKVSSIILICYLFLFTIYLISANHAYILSDGFIKEIEQCLKNKERKKTCCEALHLLIALIKNGSSQTKEIIQKGIQITLIQ